MDSCCMFCLFQLQRSMSLSIQEHFYYLVSGFVDCVSLRQSFESSAKVDPLLSERISKAQGKRLVFGKMRNFNTLQAAKQINFRGFKEFRFLKITRYQEAEFKAGKFDLSFKSH